MTSPGATTQCLGISTPRSASGNRNWMLLWESGTLETENNEHRTTSSHFDDVSCSITTIIVAKFMILSYVICLLTLRLFDPTFLCILLLDHSLFVCRVHIVSCASATYMTDLCQNVQLLLFCSTQGLNKDIIIHHLRICTRLNIQPSQTLHTHVSGPICRDR